MAGDNSDVPGPIPMDNLEHKKSDNYIEELVDKFALVSFDADDERKHHLILGRDSLYVHNELAPTDDGPSAPEISYYRLDVAGVSLSDKTATELYHALGRAIKNNES